jgi:hypothetical protein
MTMDFEVGVLLVWAVRCERVPDPAGESAEPVPGTVLDLRDFDRQEADAAVSEAERIAFGKR